jgi:hypothetical protein
MPPALPAITSNERSAAINSLENKFDTLRASCIKDGSLPICDVETGHRTSTVCNLANIAYWLERPLDWDPKKEVFKNDPEANALTKPMLREGWTLPS